MRDVPAFEFIGILVCIAVLTSAPPLGVLTTLIFVGVAVGRRNESVQRFLLADTQRNPVVNYLLPPKQIEGTTTTLQETEKETVEEGVYTVEDAADTTVPMHKAIKRIPRLVTMAQMGKAPSSSTVAPIGITQYGKPLWLDFIKDILHMGLWGTSGAGKDSWLRAMFYHITSVANPDEVQFMFIDAKSDWLVPNLKNKAHMWKDPVGGTGKEGLERLKQGLDYVTVELDRRSTLITNAGFRTREKYIEKTGENLPLLIVVFTDVMSSMKDDVEELVEDLTSKARSVGIRVIVSMQTPTGFSMRVRSNLSTILCGAQTDSSQDGPAMGLREKASMPYAPSKLLTPKQRAGMLVVRQGSEHYLVQATYIDEDAFDEYCDTLPVRNNPQSAPIKNAKNEGLASDQRIAERSGLRIDQRITHQEEEFDLLAFIVSETDKTRDSIVKSLLKNGYTYKQVRDELSKCNPPMSIGNDRIKELNQELKAESEIE